MAVKKSILGLSLCDKSIQAVELEQDGLSNTLLAIDEWENPLAPEENQNGEYVDKFASHLGHFLKTNNIRSRRISVALDSSQVFLNTVPMETNLSRAEMNNQVHWELAEYFPDISPTDFVSDLHVLTDHPDEHWQDVLTVSVRRNDTLRIQHAIKRLGLTLHVMDIDHFSADTALRVNYPDTNRKYLALIGIKENRLDISLIKNGNMESYSFTTVASNKEIVEYISTLSRDMRGIYSITVYGPFLDKDLLVQIRRSSTLLVEALNPLRHVKVADSLKLTERHASPSYRFASAIGAALRRD